MVQSRRPAGTPVGGQFAAVNRPGASLALVDGESGTVHDSLIELDRDGARQVARYEAVGSICAHLPAATRRVTDDVAAGVGAFDFDSVEQLADVALRYSARLNGLNDEAYDRLMHCLPSQMSTDIWRAARHHAREAVAELAGGAPTTSAARAHPAGTSQEATSARSGDWVCPVDASHETTGGRCTTCGASEIANSQSTEPAPPVDAPSEGLTAGYRQSTPNNRIDIEALDWTYCGDQDDEGGEKAQMLGTVFIDSTPFHVLALQVEDGDVQRALQRDDDLGMAMSALGDQAPYETVEIDGREYVLLLSPHEG